MADEGDALIREVEEELRRERLTRLWERYGIYVIAAAAAIVLGVGGYKFWQAQKLASAQAAGSSYDRAIDLIGQSKSEEATKLPH